MTTSKFSLVAAIVCLVFLFASCAEEEALVEYESPFIKLQDDYASEKITNSLHECYIRLAKINVNSDCVDDGVYYRVNGYGTQTPNGIKGYIWFRVEVEGNKYATRGDVIDLGYDDSGNARIAWRVTQSSEPHINVGDVFGMRIYDGGNGGSDDWTLCGVESGNILIRSVCSGEEDEEPA